MYRKPIISEQKQLEILRQKASEEFIRIGKPQQGRYVHYSSNMEELKSYLREHMCNTDENTDQFVFKLKQECGLLN